jgi:dihydroxyacetone kinase-like protein
VSGDTYRKIIDAACATISEHAQELTELDQAIGDGDHGINMKRGFDAIAEISDVLAGMELPAALQKAGMTLVMKVGGASGPLYGSLLMAMGKAIKEPPADAASFADMLEAGVEAVKARGKSDTGAKTMLDVLAPVAKAIRANPDHPCKAAREAADAGLESTREMLATKGRASFLGERSIGHLDPGARSSALLVHAVCGVLEAS